MTGSCCGGSALATWCAALAKKSSCPGDGIPVPGTGVRRRGTLVLHLGGRPPGSWRASVGNEVVSARQRIGGRGVHTHQTTSKGQGNHLRRLIVVATKHSARTSGTSAPELPPPLPTSSCLPWRRSPVPGHRDPGAGAVNSGAGAAETGAGAAIPAPPRGDGPGDAGPAPRSRLWAKTTCAGGVV